MTRNSVDLPQPDGPMSEMNSPAGDLQVDSLEGRRRRLAATREDLVDAGEADDRGGRLRGDRRRRAGGHGLFVAPLVWADQPAAAPGLPRRTRISAARMTEKKAIPSSDAARIAVHSFSGPVA